MTTDSAIGVTSSGTGIYLSFATTNNVFLNCVASSAGAVAGTINSGVTSTAYHTYLVTVTSSEVALTVDGVAIGSITSTSQIPNTALNFVPAALVNGGTSAGIIIDYLQIVSTKSIRP
jgi:beta-glucanase (GH16 family)